MKKHFRIAALQCNFQTGEQTLKMPEKWADFGFDTEQLLHTHADMYSAIYDETRHGKLVEQYMQNSAANGIQTIVYMNCHILGPSIADRKDEWAIQRENGEFPLYYGTYPGCCLNSSWVEYFHDCIASLKKYNIYGLFFDGPFYDPCACPRCLAKFEKTYGKSYDQATKTEKLRFAYESVIEFKTNLYNHVKSVNPKWQMYFNEGLFAGRANSEDFVRQLASNDIVGTEGGFFYYIKPKDHEFFHCAAAAKLAEAVAGDKPTVIFFAGDHKSWGWFMHTSAETKLCYLSALGNGASIWYGIHCNPDNLDYETGDTVKELVQFDKKYSALYENTRSCADIAVFYSYDTACSYRQSGMQSDLYGADGNDNDFPGDYRAAVNGAMAVLANLNKPFDMVSDLNLEDLKRYKVVLAPSLAMVSDKVKNALLDYVEQGGTLIADGEFGMYELGGKKRSQGAFDDILKCKLLPEYIDNKTFNYCKFDESIYTAPNANGWLPIPLWGVRLEPQAGCQVIAKANPPLVGCYERHPGAPEIPFALQAQYGKGNIYYIGGGCYEFYFDYSVVAWREALQVIIDRSSENKFAIRNASTAVMITVRETVSGETLIHLTNYTSATRPIEKSAVLHDLVLEVPEKFTAAEDIWSGKSLKQLAPGKFAIDALSEIAVIKLA